MFNVVLGSVEGKLFVAAIPWWIWTTFKITFAVSFINKTRKSFLDPRPWLEGSYELGSVHPSVLLSIIFLGIGSLDFSETQQNVWGPCVVVHDRARFFEKYLFAQKWGNGPKTGFLKFIGRFSHYFFLSFIYKESF